MTRKQFFSVLLVLFLPVLLTGCFKQGQPQQTNNTQPTTGAYYYENKDLGFSLNLPKEFQYFQTQRKNQDKYTDLEIFVPTNDTKYPQEVPSYAKPVVIRVYSKKSDFRQEPNFQKLGESGDRVYAIMFWQKVPSDWKGKWSDDLKNQMINSIKID